MVELNTYSFIIGFSIITILSYFFNIVNQKTNVPTVIMLVATGLGLQLLFTFLNIKIKGLQPLLEILGTVGLVLIVLEGALDLKITREKMPMIVKSFALAVVNSVLTVVVITFLLILILKASFENALIYSIPLSILSSAIVIPSVANLSQANKEFLTYESTISDILGIMAFYLVLGSAGASGMKEITMLSLSSILITVGVSLILGYVMVLIFQNIKSKIKLFVMIAVLLLLYSVGKAAHLSSLLIILIFGLMISNPTLFFYGFLNRFLKLQQVQRVHHDFELITIESAFVLRTFFFVVFGITLNLESLKNLDIYWVSGLILAGIYLFRWLPLTMFTKPGPTRRIFLMTAPRGLITILLFYQIPESYRIQKFDEGILLLIVLATAIVMTVGMILQKKDPRCVEQDTDSAPRTQEP